MAQAQQTHAQLDHSDTRSTLLDSDSDTECLPHIEPKTAIRWLTLGEAWEQYIVQFDRNEAVFEDWLSVAAGKI